MSTTCCHGRHNRHIDDMKTHVPSAVALLAAFATGCSSTCPQVKQDYEARVAAETPFVARTADAVPTHFGITLRSSVLNRIVEFAVHDGLGRALDLADQVTLASGQSISIKIDGEPAALAVYADAACAQCLRVSGKLDGTVSVKVPILPMQRVPLNGTFSLVAPIEFARNDAGRSEVKLNLEKMATLGKSSLDAEFGQLPPTWANVLRSPISQKLLTSVASKLGSVTLMTFNGPSLGIDGLEVFPTILKTDAAKGLIYLGLGSNLAAEGDLQPMFDINQNQNAAISINPQILIPALQAALKSSKIARRYTKDGKDDPNGEYFVTMTKFAAGADSHKIAFRLSNLPENGQCYWVDAEADTKMAIVDDRFKLDISSVELKESSLPGVVLVLANWASSSFLGEGKRVMNTSLSDQVLEIPGSTSRMKGTSFSADANAFVLKGKLDVKPAAP